MRFLEHYDDALYDFFDKVDEKLDYIITEFKDSVDGDRIDFVPMSPERLIKIWRDYATLGIVKDERGIDQIVDIFIDKIVTIHIATILTGHEETDPISWLNDHGFEMSDEELERLTDYLQDSKGQYIISDYGIDKLRDLAFKILSAKTYEEKLLYLDQVLNVIHQRSDLASYFVKGGRSTLDSLSK